MEKIVPDFVAFRSIGRLSREIVITEKIDGTNACICITEDGQFLTGSRTQWIYPEKDKDNFGFSKWAHENKEELLKLDVGTHYGEWWGQGIQRGYDLKEKRFSLFNTKRWDNTTKPSCCFVVPVLYQGIFNTALIDVELDKLKEFGSVARPGFMKPEGVVIYHSQANVLFKKTIEKDENGKNNS